MKRSQFSFMILQVPLDALLLVLAGISAYSLRFSDFFVSWKPVLFSTTFSEFMTVSMLVSAVWLGVFMMLGLYTPQPSRRLVGDILKVLWGSLIGMALISLYIVFTQQLFDSRFLIVVGWFLGFMFVSSGRVFMRLVHLFFYKKGLGLTRVVIIGESDVADELEGAYRRRSGFGVSVVKRFREFSLSDIDELIECEPEEIIFTDIKRTDIAIALTEYCNDRHITFKYTADLLGAYFSNVSLHPVAGIPLAELKRTPLEGWGRVLKRLFDIILSIIVIIITAPITLLTALAIVLETGLPVIYRNERVGEHGVHFMIYKFRSMYQQSSTGRQFGTSGKEAMRTEEELIRERNTRVGPIYKIADDPRVTPLGRFIRRWSIDELPNFWNVLGGSMSIVGPRPHQLREVEKYEREDRKVFAVKPGITGLAQISGRSDLTFEEEMRLDAMYLKNWHIITDIIIFVKTPFVLFRKRKVA